MFALMCALLIPGALNVLVRCETDLFVLGPVAVALLWLTRENRPFARGALLGFAAALKVLPGLFAVYLISRRQWRALGGMAAMGAFCTVVLPALVLGPQRMWSLHVEWVRAVVAPYHSEGAEAVVGASARVSNQSLAAALKRFLTPELVRISRKAQPRAYNVADWPPESVRALTKTLQSLIAAGLLALWVFGGRGGGSDSAALLFAAVAPGILLLSDVSLTTHHVLLILPLALVVGQALDDDRAVRWLWILTVYVLACLGGMTHAVRPFTPLLPLTVCLLAACVALGVARSG